MEARIGIVAPYPDLAQLCDEVCHELGETAEIRVAELVAGVEVAREMERSGVDVIISRGGGALAIERAVEVPVVAIEVSPLDLMRAVAEARKLGRVIGAIGFRNVVYGIDEVSQILDVKVVPIIMESVLEAESKILAAVRDGVEVLVGDVGATKATSALGIRSVLIRSGKDAVGRAIVAAKQVAAVRQREKERASELRAILDFAFDGIVGVGPDGRVRHFNPVSERILGVTAKAAIGRNISDIIPGTSVSSLLKSRAPEVGEVSRIGQATIVSTRVPIIVDGNATGAVITFQDVTKIQQLEEKVRKQLRAKGHVARYTFDDIISVSKPMRDLVDRARKYSRVDSTVLITGETGTGKELFAQSIHNESRRRSFPFVAINCAALPEALLESELFGYEEGAFTGARRGGKRGLIEQAHRGTIFLDEIGHMPLQLQSRLLRVLEEREVMRVGSDGVIPVDVRVISATNADLNAAITRGQFREDLYYRLNTLVLDIPPLRARSEDIAALCEHLFSYYCDRLGVPLKHLSQDALQVLQAYPWHGNVRELKNVIERIVITAEPDIVGAAEASALLHYATPPRNDLPTARAHGNAIAEATYDDGAPLSDIEKQAIERALKAANGNRTRAARMLGISRTTLWRKLRQSDSTE
ncbi:MAG: Limonene hydroxylase [Firmicutes bacterium ADurb.Bin506]|nr:MAG: Limonene hydroxylase [Firmicutes bacterium ADurb.Bin506]